MIKKLNLYRAIDTSVYVNDGVFEALILSFKDDITADTVAKLLNDAYYAAYQDGWNAALSNSHSDLMNELIALSIRNQQLEKRINELDSSV